jgi:type I restriction enzyme S subunit
MIKNKKTPEIRFKGFTEDWEQRKLNDITDRIIVGLATSVTPYYRQSGIPLLRNMNIKENYLDDKDILYLDKNYANSNETKKIKKGDILTVHTGSNIGLTCQIPDKYAGSLSFTTLITSPSKEILNGKFLSQYMNSYIGKNRVLSLITAGGKPNLNSGDLIKLELYISKNIEEQNKIGTLFENIDNLINLHQCKYEKLINIKKAMLDKMFPKNSSKIPEIRFKGFTKDWEQHKLKELVKYRRGSFPQPYGREEWYGGLGAMPFVQVADVGDDLKLVKETKQTISKLAQPMSVYIPKNSVIVTLQGTIGRVALTQYNAFLDRTVLFFDTYLENNINKYFWAITIKNKFEEERKKAPGAVIKTITKEALSEFDINITKEPEQSRIGDFFKSIDTLITLHQRKLEKLNNIKKSMLDKMFV